jgi:radical SAM protein with 4Fe4S-binding SPASM domain
MSEILKSTELTGVIGRQEMDKLELVYGEKWKEYRARYEDASNLELSKYPIQLDIELNASCNLRCPMCPISAESSKGKGKKTWFPFEKFKEIIDDGVKNGLCALKLNYVNEPLIRKDLDTFIKYATTSGILDVYLSTNGVLMDRSFSEKMIKSGLTRVQVSIDATTKDIYDKMRPGGDFKKVLENIDILLKVKEELGSVTPLVRVNFVRTEDNEHQVEEFIQKWKDKVDMVGIQEFISPTISSKNMKSKSSINKAKNNFRCSFPFKQLVITNEMNVLPCCTFWGEELSLGKLDNAEDIKKFWNSDKIKQLRKMHLDGRYAEIPECKKCVEGGLS